MEENKTTRPRACSTTSFFSIHTDSIQTRARSASSPRIAISPSPLANEIPIQAKMAYSLQQDNPSPLAMMVREQEELERRQIEEKSEELKRRQIEEETEELENRQIEEETEELERRQIEEETTQREQRLIRILKKNHHPETHAPEFAGLMALRKNFMMAFKLRATPEESHENSNEHSQGATFFPFELST